MYNEVTCNLHGDRVARQTRGMILTLAVLLAAGCAPATDDPQIEEPPLPPADTTMEPAPSTTPGAGREEVKEGSISLEGTQEPMTFNLYRSQEGFPLPFSTYVPEDMVAEEVSSGEGEAVRFVANFGGTRNEDAYLSVTVPPAGMTAAEASELVRGVAEGMGSAEQGSGERYPWALEWYTFRGGAPSAVGTVALGRHGGRYFYIVVHYPAEYGDGMGPRVAQILEDWRWGVAGGGLGS